MPEHVLVLSAGESLLENYIATVRALTPPPTDVYVICENSVYEGIIDPRLNEERRERQIRINEGIQSAILNTYYGQMLYNGINTLDKKLGKNADGTTRIVEGIPQQDAADIIDPTQQITLLQAFRTLPQTSERFNIETITRIDVTATPLQCNNEAGTDRNDKELSAVLQRISQRHPNAKFTFNLSGGLNELKFNMFLIALWCGADVCLTPCNDNGCAEYRPLPIPKVPVRDLSDREKCILKIIEAAGNNNDNIDYRYLIGIDRYNRLLCQTRRNRNNETIVENGNNTQNKIGNNIRDETRMQMVRRDVGRLAIQNPNVTYTRNGLGLIEDIGEGRTVNYRLTPAGRLACQYLSD